MSKGNELWFYCSCLVPTRLSVFNKQAGQVRRSCCLISLCSTLWCCVVPPPRGTCARGTTWPPPPPQQRQTKNMQTSFLLNIASAGRAQQPQCWLTEGSVLAPAVASSRCLSSKCGKLNKISIFCPMVWENAVIWTKSNSILYGKMQGLNDWMCSSISPTLPINLFHLPLRRICFMPQGLQWCIRIDWLTAGIFLQ